MEARQRVTSMSLIQVRRDTAAAWTLANTNLATGEIGFETDTGKFKVGNGTAWNSLGYFGLGANTFSGTQSLAGNIIDKPQLQSVRETKASPTISSGTLTLDLNTSNFFAVSLNAGISTLTITNVPTGAVASFTLEFTADGTARAVTWPASFRFPANTTPSLTSASGKRDVFTAYSSDDGATWNIFVSGQNI